MGEVAVILRDGEGWKVPGRFSSAVGKVFRTSSVTVKKVLRGELLVALKSVNSSHQREGHPPPNYHLKKDHNVVLYCKADDVAPLIDHREVALLEGIGSSTSRHALFVEGDRLEWAHSLKHGTDVHLNISPNPSAPLFGVGAIRYIGEVIGQPGWLFGVEIMVSISIMYLDTS